MPPVVKSTRVVSKQALKSTPAISTSVSAAKEELRKRQYTSEKKLHSEEANKEVASGLPANEFSQEQLQLAWEELHRELGEEVGSLERAILRQASPLLVSSHCVQITLSNAVLVGKFERLKPQLLKKLREKLLNFSFDLEAVVQEVEAEKRELYTHDEKIRYLLDTYPVFSKMYNEWQLDTLS